MASQSRKHRGYRSQRVVAEHFARTGWPFAESTGAGRSGSDITGIPGLACEVKARSDLQPLAWLKQAEMNDGLPFVVFRPNGMGEESVGRWGVLVRLEVFTQLLRDAGFGDDSSRGEGESSALLVSLARTNTGSPAEAGDDAADQKEQQVEDERTTEDGTNPSDDAGVMPVPTHVVKAT